MRKRLSLVALAMFAGTVASIGAAAPAYACHEIADDPVYNFVCNTVHAAPEPGPTINHYYWAAWGIIDTVYCTASPTC